MVYRQVLPTLPPVPNHGVDHGYLTTRLGAKTEPSLQRCELMTQALSISPEAMYITPRLFFF
jgi:hypothetical protein